MIITLKTQFNVLGKPEPISTKDNNGYIYKLLVMQSEDCGSIFVGKSVYESAEIGKNNIFKCLFNTDTKKLTYKEICEK